MKREPEGHVIVEHFEDGVIIHISTEATCFSFAMDAEDARKLSADLFSKYVDITILKQYERGI